MNALVFFVILALYGGIQAYFAHKVVAAFTLAAPGATVLYGFAVLMTVGPLVHWWLARGEAMHVPAVVSAWLVFGWMGFSFLFFWIGVAFDGWALLARHAALPMLAAKPALALAAALAGALWLVGFYAAWHPRVERVTLHSAKLAPGTRLRIAQISDLHLGVLIGARRLERVLDTVRALDPDMLVSTGDLVDAEAHFVDGLSARFAAYRPALGKFAVTGNHERYVGLRHALDFHQRSGFTVLRGQAVDVAPGVTLAGVDDPAVRPDDGNEQRLLAALPADRFVVLLKHQPLVSPGARFDLQLSGHTHCGQIFPFGLLVRLRYPMLAGRHALANGGVLYVSRGTGTWGPPIRILAPAEITLIEILPAAGVR